MSSAPALELEVAIRALRLSGWHVRDVAAEVGCSVSHVCRTCAGLDVSPRGAPLSEERREEARRLLLQGLAVHEVAAQLGMAERTAARVGHEAGLPYRRYRGGPARALGPARPPLDRGARIALIRDSCARREAAAARPSPG